jgi:hypothetical protein
MNSTIIDDGWRKMTPHSRRFVSLKGAAGGSDIVAQGSPRRVATASPRQRFKARAALVLVIAGAGKCEAGTRCLMDCQYLRSLGGVATLQQISK